MLIYSDEPNDSTFQQSHQVDKNTPSSIECRAYIQNKSSNASMAFHIKPVGEETNEEAQKLIYIVASA
jgi:hypothetical protein